MTLPLIRTPSGARLRLTPLGRLVVLAAIATGSWFAVSSALLAGHAPGSRLTTSPSADGFVSSTHPARNFGYTQSLQIDGAHVAYLSFSVPPLSGPLQRATLRVRVIDGAGRVKVTGAAPTSWREGRLTSRNAPAYDASGPVSGLVRAGKWTSVDVTPLVDGGSRLTLALTSVAGAQIDIASRESRRFRPTLALASGPPQPSLPLRAAFYYPWYPAAWKQNGLDPYTHYTPSLGFYNSGNRAVIREHVAAMLYGRIKAGIVSWWGPRTRTDSRMPALLQTTTSMHSAFRWAIYYEREGHGDPTPSQIRSDLAYVERRYASSPSYLRLHGRFVVFVYADPGDRCGMVNRWRQAGVRDAYLVLKVFPGYRSCPRQPDGWHQYGPAVASDTRPGSYSVISPGFFKAGEQTPRLDRDINRWRGDIRTMIASRAPFQLVTTFNEWGEGTAVESAREWESPSGYGAYLDALHDNGAGSTTAPPPPAQGDVTIAAAGDIACDPASGNFKGGLGTATNCHELATSNLLVGTKLAAVLTLGDTQYENNAYDKFLQSFDPTWGRVKALIRPTIGNHEYLTHGAAGYFQYFGAAAGAPDKAYYSYDLGAWHLISLNAECGQIGGCGKGSAQETWLMADLAAHHNRCVLAYWHEPRFSSGQHGDAQQMATIWNDLVTSGADVVLSGHNHVYERFDPLGTAPQSSDIRQNPTPDPNGIREFVVGTGGKNHTTFPVAPLTGEVVRNDDTYGVLMLTLRATSYDWRFVPEAGGTFTDAGSSPCH